MQYWLRRKRINRTIEPRSNNQRIAVEFFVLLYPPTTVQQYTVVYLKHTKYFFPKNSFAGKIG